LAGEPRVVAELRPKLVFVPVLVRRWLEWWSLSTQMTFPPNVFAPGVEGDVDRIGEHPAL
jgi:hypothetical protein